VTTTAGSTNFTKETLEKIPTTKNMWQALSMAPGVRASSVDVGGNQLGNQQGYKSFGASGQVTPEIEGLNTRQADSAAGMFYDDVWADRGGTRVAPTHFELPLAGSRRPLEEVAAKKRSMYRRRYEMLDAIDAALPTDLTTAERRHFDAR